MRPVLEVWWYVQKSLWKHVPGNSKAFITYFTSSTIVSSRQWGDFSQLAKWQYYQIYNTIYVWNIFPLHIVALIRPVKSLTPHVVVKSNVVNNLTCTWCISENYARHFIETSRDKHGIDRLADLPQWHLCCSYIMGDLWAQVEFDTWPMSRTELVKKVVVSYWTIKLIVVVLDCLLLHFMLLTASSSYKNVYKYAKDIYIYIYIYNACWYS